MAQLIDKDVLVAEIEKTYKFHEKRGNEHDSSICDVLYGLSHRINTLEVKEVDDELQGIEKEVAEGFVEMINKKRIPISLKGEKKAKFKNEFNTLWQVVDGIQFANVAKYIIERLCLHFAAWGAYNLKGIGQIDKDDKKKMDVEVKEVDLEKHLKEDIEDVFFDLNGVAVKGATHYLTVEDVKYIAKHFYELGFKAQKG